MTKDEKNRKLAEWLGWRFEGGYWHHPHCYGSPQYHKDCGTPAFDFYTSEDASTLLLEKMPRPRLEYCDKLWEVWPDWLDNESQQNACRKTAIAEAALKLIELENQR